MWARKADTTMQICENCQYNQSILNRIKSQIPDETTTSDISNVFKVFADNTRIRLLWALFDSEMCVIDICEALNMTQSAISHQLKTLKEARLVKSRRDGKNTFYSIDDEHVKRIIEQVLIHIEEGTV